MNFIQLEGVAADCLSSSGIGCPVDAFLVADSQQLLLTPVGRCEEGFDGLEIRFNARAPHRAQQEFVARCIAKAALERAGFYATEHAVARVARALMLPRREFAADMEQKRGLEYLRARHTHASTAMIGARAGDLYVGQRALTA